MRDLVGREAEYRRDRLLLDGRGLGANPDLAPVRAEPDHAVERLHGSVREVRELVDGLEHPGRAGQRRLRVTLPARPRARLRGEHTVGGVELRAPPPLGGGLVPVDAQGARGP